MDNGTPNSRHLTWRVVFAAAALWTATGAVPGFLDTATTFTRFHGFAADSPLLLEIYRGAWGQSLLFAVGYVLAAFDPFRHAGIIALGGVGKAVYAANLIDELAAGTAGPLALPAVVGDLLFTVAFAAFLLSTGALWRRRGSVGAAATCGPSTRELAARDPGPCRPTL